MMEGGSPSDTTSQHRGSTAASANTHIHMQGGAFFCGEGTKDAAEFSRDGKVAFLVLCFIFI